MEKPETKTGIVRLVRSFFYSLQGLKSCFRNEEAFRIETVLFLLLLPVIILMPLSPTIKLFLFLANCQVLIVELLNSAVEAVVDKASPEYSTLAGQAKDMGSAAVLISLVFGGVVWGYALYTVLAG